MSNRLKPCAGRDSAAVEALGNERPGSINGYGCVDRHATFTINADRGTTPASIACPYAGCDKRARSMFYRLPDDFRPAFVVGEWYRPSASWARRQGPAMVQHVRAGGLVIRNLLPATGMRFKVGEWAPDDNG